MQVSESKPALRREAAWVVLGQFGTLLGALALVRVQTGLLSPAEYGDLALAITLFSFGQMAVFGGLTLAITRLAVPALRGGGYFTFLRSGRRALLLLSLGWALPLLLLAAGLGFAGWSQWAVIVLAVLPASVLNGWLSALTALYDAARARKLVALHQCADAALRVCFLLILARWFAPSIPLIFIAYGLSSLCVLIALAMRARPTPSQPVSQAPKPRTLFHFAWPLYLWQPFAWAQLVSDRWALELFASGYALGLYAVAAQITLGPARIAITTFIRYFAPVFFERMTGNRAAQSQLRRLILATAALTAIGFSLAALLRDPILALVAAPEYHAASAYLPWLVLAAGCAAAAEIASLQHYGTGETKALIAPRIITAAIGIPLSLWGAWMFGVAGVVAAQVAHSVLLLIWLGARSLRPLPA